jgi:hypothetical protein
MPGSEILVLVMAPFLLVRHGERAFRREYLWFYLLLFGWFLGTIMSDVYMDSPFSSRLKGIARVVFFGLDFIVLAILINRKARGLIVFALSMIPVRIMGVRALAGEFSIQWKFGLGICAAVVLTLISSHFYAQRKYWTSVFLSLFLAALNLIFAARSAILVALVSCALIMPVFVDMPNKPNKGKRGARAPAGRGKDLARAMILLLLAGAGAYLANKAVEWGASHNLFSEGTQEKFQQQASGKLGMLIGGRPETLVAIQAIRDSPILGHGSFAMDVRYLEMMQDIQYEYGYTETDEPEETDTPGIPTHSHLTLAWVDSGILGGIFWIYIMILTIRAILALAFLRPALAPLYCYFLVEFVWDILYSPMGSVDRIMGDYFILIGYQILTEQGVAMASSRSRGLLSLARRRPAKVLVGAKALPPRSVPNRFAR